MAVVSAEFLPTLQATLGDLGVIDCFDVIGMANGLADIDVDFARFHGVRYLALQFNLKQPVLKRSLFHFDEISEAEAPLEMPRGNAAVSRDHREGTFGLATFRALPDRCVAVYFLDGRRHIIRHHAPTALVTHSISQ